MSLKTAALIAIIGIAVHFLLSFSSISFHLVSARVPFRIYLTQFFWLFNSIIFNGSLILFLAVFYSKQNQ